MRKLTVVVTCSDRKSVQPMPTLTARTLPAGSVSDRVATWKERLRSAGGKTSLGSLYSGEHWMQCNALMTAATSAGFEPELWVASAGLGLQPVERRAPAYAATFSSAHPDAVAADLHTSKAWWSELQRVQRGALLPELAARGCTLVVLSGTYARAVRCELVAAGAIGANTLLIGGDEEIPGIPRIPADRRLRHRLGGTLTSLNARMATRWLEQLQPGEALTSPAATHRWNRWVTAEARVESYSRTPVNNDAVRQYIRKTLAARNDVSRSRLLRLLRDQGMACEQARFATLYDEVVRQHV